MSIRQVYTKVSSYSLELIISANSNFPAEFLAKFVRLSLVKYILDLWGFRCILSTLTILLLANPILYIYYGILQLSLLFTFYIYCKYCIYQKWHLRNKSQARNKLLTQTKRPILR